MGRRCVAPYPTRPTRPTRPLEHSHCRAKPTRTVRVHCEHILMWYECTGRTRRSGRSVYTGNPTRTVRERYARRVKLSVCTRPKQNRLVAQNSNAIIMRLPGHAICGWPSYRKWQISQVMLKYKVLHERQLLFFQRFKTSQMLYFNIFEHKFIITLFIHCTFNTHRISYSSWCRF